MSGDSYTGCGPAVYCFLDVDGPHAATSMADLEAPEIRNMGAPCGTVKRFPYVSSIPAAGRTWDVYRMDSVFTPNGGLVMDHYCIDFNDNLFLPGDTCWFFFAAQSTNGWSYFSLPYGRTSPNLAAVAAAPDEFTMLPAVGDEPGNDILYVDGMNFRGAQPSFDTAFQSMPTGIGTTVFEGVDRYDIRGPSSGVGNRPGSRVVNALTQLIPFYNKIIWNTGNLTLGCIGDGVGYEKSDDASMLLNFCDFHTSVVSGIYFNGDDIAEEWAGLTGAGAIGLRAYMNYTVTSPNHVAAGAGINTMVKTAPTSMAFHATDSMIAYGGCPLINDFDVLAPAPPLSQLEMNYHNFVTSAVVGGAIIGQSTINTASNTVRVLLSGFSYHYIRDIDSDGIVDRFHHMYDIIRWLNNNPDEPVPVTTNTRRTSLAQNYPNPFNPTTTIKYTLRDQAHVSLRVYNVAGQLVRTLVNEVQKPEAVTPIVWNGKNNAGQMVSSGVYFYKLVTKDFAQTKKMVLLK
jgi:hypothetical protein